MCIDHWTAIAARLFRTVTAMKCVATLVLSKRNDLQKRHQVLCGRPVHMLVSSVTKRR
jgi:hypothetical protein